MIWNLPPLPDRAVDRFAMILSYILAYIGKKYAPGTDIAMLGLIYGRVDRIRMRFNALVAKWRDGALPPPRRRASPAREALPEPRPRAPWPFPRNPAWLCGVVPQHVAVWAGWLRRLMDEPEMIKLVREVPRVARLLRPLFRMLGREMPAILIAPKRARPARDAGAAQNAAPRARRQPLARPRPARLASVPAAPVDAVAGEPMHDTARLGVPPIPVHADRGTRRVTRRLVIDDFSRG
jgi:hypothetical protein